MHLGSHGHNAESAAAAFSLMHAPASPQVHNLRSNVSSNDAIQFLCSQACMCRSCTEHKHKDSELRPAVSSICIRHVSAGNMKQYEEVLQAVPFLHLEV